MKVDDLIEALLKIETDDELTAILTPAQEEVGYSVDELPDVVQDVIQLADECLIGNHGQCDWDNINKVKQAGFNVRAGEQDSFGWLSGLITTSKGDVVYG
jgi:hypothetical protein